VSEQAAAPMTAGEYCRAIEAHLCRQNGGHLVRIVGPAFQTVSGWFAKGIPFAIVRQGIDRTVARDRAKPQTGSARRPVRVEFCEADVLDAFDAWRRAVGVGMAGDRDDAARDAGAGAPPPDDGDAIDRQPRSPRTPSLATHVDRAMQRLTQALLDLGRFTPAEAAAARSAMESALAALDGLRTDARTARGAARAAVQASLAAADAALAGALVAAMSEPAAAEVSRAARAELAPFADRLAAADLAAAEAEVTRRLARERFGAPVLTPRF
jgi:hypothetical protein